MNIIFIDANIYLNFYDSNKPELKKLLDSIFEIKSSLFINRQIANEVSRNKLDVAQRSLMNHFKNLSEIKEINLPEQLDMEITSFKDWNNNSKSLHKKQKELQNNLENIIHKTLEKIMLSTDRVSVTFNYIFESAIEISEDEIQAARLRRELGNPPGKPDDPLGDQISWEQFLKHSSKSENIWIITNDSDYYTTFKNKRYLNPFLYDELIKRSNNNPSIFCFASLAEGLKHFNDFSSEKIDKLPTEEELDNIAEEELSNLPSQIENSRVFPIVERGEVKYMHLPPGFQSPNHYIQYLRAFDSDDL